jgi:hypothetical protein
LEGIFGDRLDALTYEQVASLAANSVTEDYDLDFKAELYGRSDKARRDLAGDVAAMANTAGGVLVLGIAEDDQARAAGLPGVELSDEEGRRYRQIVGDLVHPQPAFETIAVENPAKPGHGFLLIAVPRSPLAPHAVHVDKALRYPKRYGTTTTYLAEAQVALAYRERFAGFQRGFEDLEQHEADLVQRLDGKDQAFVVVTLIPDMSGDFILDTQAMRQFQQQTTGKDPWLLQRGTYFERATVGSRRLIAYTGNDPTASRYQACELHQSGAGAIAIAVTDRQSNGVGANDPGPGISLIDDEDLVLAVISGLRFVARHARDRAAAGGNATVRASLWPVSQEIPAELHQARSFRGRLGAQRVTESPVASGVFDIDDLAEDGPALFAAGADLSSSLIQHFGYPEALQVTREGSIRTQYWNGQGFRPRLLQWAAEAGVPTTDATLA